MLLLIALISDPLTGVLEPFLELLNNKALTLLSEGLLKYVTRDLQLNLSQASLVKKAGNGDGYLGI